MRFCEQIPVSWWAKSCLIIAFPCTVATAKQTAYVIFGFLNVSSGINRVFLFAWMPTLSPLYFKNTVLV